MALCVDVVCKLTVVMSQGTSNVPGAGQAARTPSQKSAQSSSISPARSSSLQRSGSSASLKSADSTISDKSFSAKAKTDRHRQNSKNEVALPVVPDKTPENADNPNGINVGLPPVVYHRYHYIIDTSKPLAEGGFGKIYKCWKKEEPKVIKAAKVIRITEANKVWADNCLKAEIRIHDELSRSCDQIVTQYDHIKTRNWGFIFMELAAHGSVESFVKKLRDHELVPPDRVKKWMVQITTALQFMHSRGYAHRDIKLDNFLLRSPDEVTLSDFGISVKCFTNVRPTTSTTVKSPLKGVIGSLQSAHGSSALTSRSSGSGSSSKSGSQQGSLVDDLNIHPLWRYTQCGTERYLAPEVFNPPYDGLKADVYALGVALFELTNGVSPFGTGKLGDKYVDRSPTRFKVVKRLRNEYSFSGDFKAGDLCKSLIKKMLQGDYRKRASAQEVLDHPWLK